MSGVNSSWQGTEDGHGSSTDAAGLLRCPLNWQKRPTIPKFQKRGQRVWLNDQGITQLNLSRKAYRGQGTRKWILADCYTSHRSNVHSVLVMGKWIIMLSSTSYFSSDGDLLILSTCYMLRVSGFCKNAYDCVPQSILWKMLGKCRVWEPSSLFKRGSVLWLGCALPFFCLY